jgi:two-component system LytT family sensor kinase
MKIFAGKYFSRNLHIAIWIVVVSIPTIIFWNQPAGSLSTLFYFLSTLYNIGFFYFNACFLYPRLLTRKKWWLYILSIAAMVHLSYQLKLFVLRLNPGFQLTEDNRRIIFFSLIPFLVASIVFRLVSDRIRFERLEKEARAERLATELKFLRSQISPHFLFNMLTNMVSLARQKSDLLEPALINLSELLRYMLYESSEERIEAAKEIENIENYIALQQLRFGEDVALSSTIVNECSSCLIEPMLLIPFIENAFKHGIGLLKNPNIKIELYIKEHTLDFTIVNRYSDTHHSKDKNAGIGLQNVKNRLALLYPDKHRLSITSDADTFIVHLNLVLL